MTDPRFWKHGSICPGLGSGLALACFVLLAAPAHSADEAVPGRGASGAASESSSNSFEIAGRFFNSPPESDCREVGGSSLCSYEIRGFSVAEDGERYRHSIVGISHGDATAPGGKSWSQSFVVWEFDDGSSVLMESEGTTTVDADGQRTVAGEQRCIRGTGRFANVDCSIDWSHSGRNDGSEGGVYEGTGVPRDSP